MSTAGAITEALRWEVSGMGGRGKGARRGFQGPQKAQEGPCKALRPRTLPASSAGASMASLPIEIEHDPETGSLVGSVPGVPGAHTQGATVEEVRSNLAEVVELLREEDVLPPAA